MVGNTPGDIEETIPDGLPTTDDLEAFKRNAPQGTTYTTDAVVIPETLAPHGYLPGSKGGMACVDVILKSVGSMTNRYWVEARAVARGGGLATDLVPTSESFSTEEAAKRAADALIQDIGNWADRTKYN